MFFLFKCARTDFLLELVLELVGLVKLRPVTRGHNQLSRVVAGGGRITAYGSGESGQAEEEEEEGAARKEAGRPSSSCGHREDAIRVLVGGGDCAGRAVCVGGRRACGA